MKTNITQENLLQFIYGELSPDMHIAIMDELEINEELRAQYNALRQGINLLDNFQVSPSKTSIKILMEESSESSSMEGIS